MKVSALISAALHLIILVVMYTGLPLFQDPEVFEQPRVIEVDLVEIADITNLPKPQSEPEEVKPEPPKPVPQKPEPKPEPKPLPPKPQAPEPEPKPEPIPEPTPPTEPEPAPRNEPEPAPVLKPEPKPEPKEEVKPEEKKAPPVPKPRVRPKPKTVKAETKKVEKKPEKKFDLSQISALLDKKKQEKSSQKTEETDTKKSQSAGKVANSSSKGADRSLPLSISEIDALRQQVQKCWNVPTGSVNAEDLVVKLRISLDRDGKVQGQPEVIRSGSYRNNFEKIATESAIRAVLRCGPYRLPAAKYDRWKNVVLNFDPREMFGQ